MTLKHNFLALALLSVGPTPGLADAAAPPADALIAELSMNAAPGTNRIAVNLAPEGKKPFVLWLDTGATASVLTPGAARAQGIIVRRGKGREYVRETRLGRDLYFWVDTRSSDQAGAAGWEYGVLGGQFLSDYVVELDFDAERVRFYDAKKYEVPQSVSGPDEAVLPVRITSNRPFIQIDLGCKKPLQVLVDTGAPIGPLLSKRAIDEQCGVKVKKLPEFHAYLTTRGKTQTRILERQPLRIGPFALGEAPVLIAPQGSFNLGGNTDSLIGYDVISQFKVRIDYPRQRLWLQRRSNARMTIMGSDVELAQVTGAYLFKQPLGYAVAYVRKDSPAERYGLRSGDYFDLMTVRTQKLTDQTIAAAILDGATLLGSRPIGRDFMDATEVEYPGGVSAIPGSGTYNDEF